ncbi:uncharacterized protein M6B38_102565 [Iris pallida]|uniref:FAS1 domain-containing protein n=1 Tax=Iris pallida TaxID=29817 RepID=A0AAX6G6L6_IRIPA|nr:uncharacterized protein M6B38_102565 [Iris pallida]
MASKHLSFLPLPLLLLLLLATAARAAPVNITGSRDITTVLNQFPNFSTLNKLLTQTKVVSDINSRQTITIFVVADSAISSLTSLPSDVQQKVLSLHVVLDYYDIDKLTNLPNTTGELTTLFQASGKAANKNGFINATDVGDGQIKLGSAEDNQLTSDVVREIAMQPFNISIVEISQMIIPSSIASGGGSNGSSSGSGSGSGSSAAMPTPAPKAGKSGAPKAAPVPSGSSSAAPKSNSSDETPAPATTDAPAGPATDVPVGSAADAPAGSTDEIVAPAKPVKKSSSASRLGVGVGIAAAVGAAFFAAL